MDGTSSGLDEHLGGTSLAGGGLGVGSKGWLGLGWLGNLKGAFAWMESPFQNCIPEKHKFVCKNVC